MSKTAISIISTSILAAVISLSSPGDKTPAVAAVPGGIRVAMASGVPGFFTLNGKTFGYQYELVNEFGKAAGKEVEIVPGHLAPDHPTDMAAGLRTHIVYGSNTAVPVYSTRYVVLASKKTAKEIAKDNGGKSVYEILGSGRLMVSQGFAASGTYDEMMDSLKGTRVFLSSKNSFDLIEALGAGRYDFLICEESEARLGCTLVRNITRIMEFEEDIPVYMLFSAGDHEFAQDFRGWLESFRGSERDAELTKFYFENGIANHIIMGGINDRDEGGISAYDDILRRVCREEGMDWRLVSAIAYNESKFNPYIVSPRGARGIMQIMPSVAGQFGYAEESLMDPETNITAGVKVLKTIERSLEFAPGTHAEERMRIILACYNGGIGHVGDARRLASKYGENPDSWESVRKYLELKAHDEYASDEVVGSGTFGGIKETAAFVSNVIERYKSYCLLVSL